MLYHFQIIFNNLGALNSDLVLSSVHERFSKTISSWQNVSYQEVELVMSLLYALVEAVPGNSMFYIVPSIKSVDLINELP